MKKSSIACAALAALSGAVSAQSSTVTLFGVLDVAARAVKNGDGSTVKSLTSDGLAFSRLGFRGEEDLGGGLKASFWLEAGLNADVGSVGVVAPSTGTGGAAQGAKFFNRRSTVSLAGPFGEVRLGRDFVPTYLNLSQFDVYGGVGVGNLANLFGSAGTIATLSGTPPPGTLGSNVGTLLRADNSIAYHLPANIGGVYGSVMAAAGEGTNASNGNNRYVGGRVGWAGGPFDVAGAYARTRIPGHDDFRVWNVGAAFTLPVATPVKLMAVYHRADWQPAGLDNRSQKLWSVSARVPLGQGELRAAYARSDIGGGGPAVVGLRNQDDARQMAVGYIHNLSKRTALYADLGRIRNSGLSQLAIPGGTAAGSNFGTVADRDSTALALGVRHSF
jgi:predicted porin